MPQPRTIRVFIASPGDLAVERRAFKDAIDELNRGFSQGADVMFHPLGWEQIQSPAGRRTQGIINQEVDTCDIFLLVMWRRWGQAAEDAAPYTSYTEEEFFRALDRWKRTGSPEIYVLFKRVEEAQELDAGDQLRRVVEFRARLDEAKMFWRQVFADQPNGFADNPPGFVPILKDVLQAFVKHPPSPVADMDRARVVLVPGTGETLAVREERLRREARLIEVAKTKIADATLRISELEARAVDLESALAEAAQRAFASGQVDAARAWFDLAIKDTLCVEVLEQAHRFFTELADSERVEQLRAQLLHLSRRRA